MRYSETSKDRHPPTVVLVHGILGSRRNMQQFARMITEVRPHHWSGSEREGPRWDVPSLSACSCHKEGIRAQGPSLSTCRSASPAGVAASSLHLHHANRPSAEDSIVLVPQGFPSWQVLLMDLRCHGDSSPLSPSLVSPHGVESAAHDVLRLLSALKIFPEVLVGHSFGGKVVMSMADIFGRAEQRLPRPVKVGTWGLGGRAEHASDAVLSLSYTKFHGALGCTCRLVSSPFAPRQIQALGVDDCM